jgi:hypothetical protein
MKPASRERTAITWLCAAAILLLGFLVHQHALSHALTTLQPPVPHDPVAEHAQACEMCLQLAGADAAVPPATMGFVQEASHTIESRAAVLPCRVEAFVAYDSRAPPRRG